MHAKIYGVRRWGIAPIALILVGAVACTSSGSGGNTTGPTSALPTTSPASTSVTPTAPSTSASPTPTIATTGPNVRPGEKPPTYPAVSKKNTRSGALSFVTYWIATLDWGYATTDSTLAKHNYLPSCTDCAKFMKNFDDAKLRGEHFKGGRVTLKESSLIDDDYSHPHTTVVDTTFAVARLLTLNNANKTVTVAPAIPSLTFRTWAAWTGTKWTVVFEKQAKLK